MVDGSFADSDQEPGFLDTVRKTGILESPLPLLLLGHWSPFARREICSSPFSARRRSPQRIHGVAGPVKGLRLVEIPAPVEFPVARKHNWVRLQGHLVYKSARSRNAQFRRFPRRSPWEYRKTSELSCF